MGIVTICRSANSTELGCRALRTVRYEYPSRLYFPSPTMSRRPQQQAPVDTSQPEVPEDELLSATGEGDEVMEEAEEQEGYSACVTLSHWRTIFTSCLPFPSSYRPYLLCGLSNTD